MNKWTKLLLMTILIAGLVVGMSNALPTRAAEGDILYRINAGGPAVGVWSADALFNPGGADSTSSTAAAIDTAGMPAYAPEAIFQTHRWDPPEAPDLSYALPLAAGVTEVDVNLFFAEITAGADTPGWRIFDIFIEGVEVSSNVDVFATTGFNNAMMLSYDAVAVTDGTLNITFVRNTRAAMVSAIEVIEGASDGTQVPTDVPTDEPTGEPTDEPTDEPTVEPTEPPIVIPDMFCSLDDGSLNALHCGRPVAIYDEGSFEIFGIDINTGNGALAFVVTDEQIAAAGVPADVPVVIATGENPYNFRPIVLYRLPSGEFQLNTYYWDGKPYSVKWDEGASTVEVVTW